MTLTTTISNKKGRQLVCENAVLDTSLLKFTEIYPDERVFVAEYETWEAVNPLNLPFPYISARLTIIVTDQEMHMTALVYEDDDEQKYHEYTSGFGDIEFQVRMATWEKIALFLKIMQECAKIAESKTEKEMDPKTTTETPRVRVIGKKKELPSKPTIELSTSAQEAFQTIVKSIEESMGEKTE